MRFALSNDALKTAGHAGSPGSFGDRSRDRDGVLLGLDYAGAANERERRLIADDEGIDAGESWGGIRGGPVHNLLIIRAGTSLST